MSGHSKWSTIKRKKEKTDSQRAKIFTKIGREIQVIVREGGGDPTSNSRLRDVIAKAKSFNVPNDNINRLIQKATADDKNNYESVIYEGYGPGGLAFIVETLTDNRNRTAANLRHYFDKYGAGLGTSGCTAYIFSKKGIILINEADGVEEKILSAPIEDYTLEDEGYEITVSQESFSEAVSYFEGVGIEPVSAEITYVPSTTVAVDNPEQQKNLELLISMLDEDDDVQDFSTNLE